MAKNHVEVLDEAGLKLDDIVCGFVYLSDMKDYDADECRLQGVLLPRPRRPDLPDARLGHRQEPAYGSGGRSWRRGQSRHSRSVCLGIVPKTRPRSVREPRRDTTSAAATATSRGDQKRQRERAGFIHDIPVITGANEPPKYPPKFWIEPSDAT